MEKFDNNIRIIDIPRINDPRGNLSFVQHPSVCPFEINRVYWLYDIPAESIRDGRALRNTDEMIIALAGSFDVILEDKQGAKCTFHLNRSYKGLYVPAGTWRSITNFVTNSVVLVLASRVYDENDYIRDYAEY